ncbi:4610_t:CDS:2 [Entrophospora sp. SA101]|nr:4610_t:CDS:2 [Entrophospora sp. SA101]
MATSTVTAATIADTTTTKSNITNESLITSPTNGLYKIVSEERQYRHYLHNGQVKQIVGGTLNDQDPEKLLTNFVSSENSGYYAKLYKQYNLTGGHIIKLGAGNNEAAKEALETWPGGLQIGGGITLDNAQEWIDYGADKIILTSYLFPDAKFSFERLKKLSEKIGKDKIVIDLR